MALAGDGLGDPVRVALHQLSAQAHDIQQVAEQAATTAQRSVAAGRPVALGPLEADLFQLKQDLADLEKLLNQLDRSLASN